MEFKRNIESMSMEQDEAVEIGQSMINYTLK